MTDNPYQGPKDADDSISHAWDKLTRYRWLIMAGVACLFLIPIVRDPTLKNVLLLSAVLTGGVGMTQAISFLCPACQGRFSRMSTRGSKLLFFGICNIPFEAGRILLKPKCQTCGTKVGEGETTP